MVRLAAEELEPLDEEDDVLLGGETNICCVLIGCPGTGETDCTDTGEEDDVFDPVDPVEIAGDTSVTVDTGELNAELGAEPGISTVGFSSTGFSIPPRSLFRDRRFTDFLTILIIFDI